MVMPIQAIINIRLSQYNLSFSDFCLIRKKRFILLVTMLIATINLAQADDGVTRKFRLALGGYIVPGYESTISLTEPNFGAGVSISPEDTLGLRTEQTVLRLDGQYRFNNAHALTFSWYNISSDGNKALEHEIDWIDENGNPITIPVGANIDTALDYDIYKIGYLWSFYHNDKVEMVAGAGLHITRVAIGLDTKTTSSGVDSKNVSTSLPLPVLSFGLIYKVTPRFAWYLKNEFFAIAFDNWEGNYTDSTAGIEYLAFKNVGLGLGLASNSLKVTEKTGDYKFAFDNRITGAMLYAAVYF